MSKLTLESVEWGEFRIKDLFEIETVKGKPIENYKKGDIPYVSTAATNNAVINFIEKDKNILTSAFAITVDPIKGTCFFHDYDFVGRGFSGASVNVLRNINLNKHNGMFICSSIEKTSKLKASYGYLFNSNRLKMAVILLPIDSNGNPNWQFMEDYIKQEMKVQSSKVASYYENKLVKLGFELLDYDVEWKEFKVKDIFEFKKKSSKGLNYLEKSDKGISYLGATNRNNGVLEFVKDDKKLKYKGNCIAFIRNGEGSMGYAVYKKEDFIATQDISVGYNDNLNLYTGTFITTIADRVRGKYNFGYKRNQNRLENEILHLPIDENDEPHWEYMSQFMKKLEKENIEKTLNHIYIYIYIYI